MRLIKRKTLIDYWSVHPETKAPLQAWVARIQQGSWSDMNALQADFSAAKALNGERMRFEICGGNYRVVVAFKFMEHGKGIAFVKFIGTHKEYDRIDALTVADY